MSRGKQDSNNNLTILFMAAGLSAIYGFPNMKGVFYDIMKETLLLSDLELSRIFAVFGIVAMVSYLFGGMIADKIPVRIIITSALVLSSVLHIVVSFILSYRLVLLISALMGVAAILLYFPATSKVLNILGERSGKAAAAAGMFGIYYAIEGTISGLINVSGRIVYGIAEDKTFVFIFMTRSFGLICMICAIVLWKLTADADSIIEGTHSVKFSQMRTVFLSHKVWEAAFLTMGMYISFTTITYLAPYLNECFGLSGKSSVTISILRVNVLTVIAGLIFAKTAASLKSTLKLFVCTFPVLMCITCLIAVNHKMWGSGPAAVVMTLAFTFFVVGLKSISISIVSEIRVPEVIMGTAIGAIALIGYSPDAYMFALAGGLLNRFGADAYLILFFISFAGSIMSLISAVMLYKEVQDAE